MAVRKYSVPAEIMEKEITDRFKLYDHELKTDDVTILRRDQRYYVEEDHADHVKRSIFNETTQAYEWTEYLGMGYEAPYAFLGTVENEDGTVDCYTAFIDFSKTYTKAQIKNLVVNQDYIIEYSGRTPSYTPIMNHYKYTISNTNGLIRTFSVEAIEKTAVPEFAILDATIDNTNVDNDILNGKGGHILLEIKDISKSILNEHKDLITEVVGDNGQITHYLDINLINEKRFGLYERITETEKEVIFSLELPEEFWNSNGEFHRNYRIVRIHDGKTDILQANFDKNTGRITFKTDAFSTYAISYQDVPAADVENTNTVTNTSSNVSSNKTSDTVTDTTQTTDGSDLTLDTNSATDAESDASAVSSETVDSVTTQDGTELSTDLPINEEEGSSTLWIVLTVVGAVVVAGAVAAVLLLKKKKSE
ncbi:MAG: hypothetical protein J6M34_01920 [Clostridia bacterium]|nr:hypothetical protein [Clostridia bacterium]